MALLAVCALVLAIMLVERHRSMRAATPVMENRTRPDGAWLTAAANTLAPAPAVPAAPTEADVAAWRDSMPNDRELFLSAARQAWIYVEKQYQPQTGMVNSVIGYPYTTMWDLASTLAALYCAEQLDILAGEEYDRRLRRLLTTLQQVKLFDNASFNRNYSTERATMVDGNQRDSERGTGVAVTDIGRLYIWLKIISNTQPQYAEEIQKVVTRLNTQRFIQQGYLKGEARDRNGRIQPYQEGRIGYEQYAAAGFEMWGAHAPNSLNLFRNAQPVTVLGVPLLADRRPGEYVTSEPFILAGLEVGWYPELRNVAWRVLAAQEARFRQTGQVTIASEDALNQPPYFLYYSLHSDGRDFVVLPPHERYREGLPRTISTKAAYAWHALLPSSYTWQAVQAVQNARTENGWGSGVYEADRRNTGAENINTAAVVLESALYYMRGRPLLENTPFQNTGTGAQQGG